MTNLTYTEQPVFRFRPSREAVEREPVSKRIAVATWIGASTLLWLGLIGLASAAVRVL